MFERRQFLQFSGAGFGLSLLPSFASAAPQSPKRLIFVIQRGAADGLASVIPTGDPKLIAQREAVMSEESLKLDGFFALHPALAETEKLYAAKEALFVHAVASPYRDRSHFDAQNVLESGGALPYAVKSGWLNRLVGMLPGGDAKALALASTIPMALRGAAQVASFAPSALPEASADLVARVGQLYAGDAQLHALWAQALATRQMAGNEDGLNARNAGALGALSAKLMAGPNGARIAMIETTGWDTHSQQKGRLTAQLNGLDALLANLKTGLGGDWASTLVIVATEFGRTVAANGTGGTDHGTASVAMLLGGAVKGGRVIADWPGLGTSSLYEGRDLKPTLGLDALLTAAVAGHFRLDPFLAARTLFPEMKGGKMADGLFRS